MVIKNFIKENESNSSFLLFIGLLSALFFSTTFLINRAISLDGGHWYFSGSLRFLYTLIFLSLGFIVFKGFAYYKKIIKEYIENFRFWTISGTIGFGFFYSLICYASDFSAAWLVATTWQTTILASLFVLSFFGNKLSKKIWIYTFFIFLGVTLVHISHYEISDYKTLLLGILPVLIAAFFYPFGNQLVWEEKKKRKELNKDIELINNTFVKVFLLCLGSFPIWIILYFTTDAIAPSENQYLSVALLAFFSGIIASSLFLYARSKANTSSKIILVDSTQSGEFFFALLGEMIFLNLAFPNEIGLLGIFITVISLILLARTK